MGLFSFFTGKTVESEEERNARISRETEEKRKIEEENNVRVKQLEEELAKEYERVKNEQLETVEKAVKNYNQEKTALSLKLMKMNESIKTNIEEQIEQLKKKGITMLEEKEKKLKEQHEELKEERRRVVYALDLLSETKKNVVEKHEQLQKEMNEKREASVKEFQEKLLKTEGETSQALVEIEKENARKQEESNKRQIQLVEKQHQLQVSSMLNQKQLLDAEDKDKAHEKLRQECQKVIRQHSRFMEMFQNERGYLVRTRDDIEDGEAITKQPDLYKVTIPLRTLSENLTSFDLGGSEDAGKMKTLCQETRVLVSQLNSIFDDLDSIIGRYISSKQKPAEEFEKIGQKPLNYSITGLCKQMDDLVAQLREKVNEFNIARPQHVAKLLTLQFESVSNPETLRRNQIENEPVGIVFEEV